MSAPARYWCVAAVAAAWLAFSLATVPGLFKARVWADEIPAESTRPLRLMSRPEFTLYWTTSDLLHPEAFGSPGEFYQAVFFDVPAAGEGDSFPLRQLTWVRQIDRALRGLEPDPELRADERARPPSADADRFSGLFSGPTVTRRGDGIFFDAPGSDHARRSGLVSFAGLAVKEPFLRGEPGAAPPRSPAAGNDTLLEPALRMAFSRLSAQGVRGVGVPVMAVGERVGDRTPAAKRWRLLLDAVDAAERAGGVRRVVMGGWALEPANRSDNRDAFADAWRAWQRKVEPERTSLVREPLRLMLFIVCLACVVSALARRPFSWPRVAALATVALGTMLTSVAGYFDLLVQSLPRPPGPALAAAMKIGLAALAGVGLETFLAFKEREKKLVLNGPGNPP